MSRLLATYYIYQPYAFGVAFFDLNDAVSMSSNYRSIVVSRVSLQLSKLQQVFSELRTSAAPYVAQITSPINIICNKMLVERERERG